MDAQEERPPEAEPGPEEHPSAKPVNKKVHPNQVMGGHAQAVPRRIRQGPLLAIGCGVVLLVTFAIFSAFLQETPPGKTPGKQAIVQEEGVKETASIFQGTKLNYGQILATGEPQQDEAPPPTLGPPLEGDLGAAGLLADAPALPGPQFQAPLKQQASQEEIRRKAEYAQAVRSSLEAVRYVSGSDPSAEHTDQNGVRNQLQALEDALKKSGSGEIPDLNVLGGGGGTRQSQDRKTRFLREEKGPETYVKKVVLDPVSPYEVKAGSVIPIVLITGINSDLPGSVTGQVREHVYDSVTGNYLLIPQGTKVIGRYDSSVTFGQERVLVVWHRLIFPDGTSFNLEGLPGVDLSGFAGIEDDVDHHWGRLLAGVILSSALAATANFSQGSFTNDSVDATQVVTSNIGQNINRTGQRITDKLLDQQPTITIRPGWNVNIFVENDLVLRPFRSS
ncbi:MAG: hypothetical protein GKS05_13215 [Nitrospirales bacterium]|nr:hypothetical protein [Nitrospirales bacterium]